MKTFEKILESLVRPESWSYFMVREFTFEFVQRFMSFIELQIGADPKLPEIETLLKDIVDIKSQFYLISELSEDIHHQWTVYEFFISGFKVNADKKVLTAIEFGLD